MPSPLRLAVPALALAAVTGLASPLCAQSDDGARLERVAEGVYVIIHRDAVRDWPSGATDWPHGNTGVIVGEDGVLVVDAAYFPSRARADIALIRRLTDRPVRYLVNTHWHGDHTHGNAVYRATFPGLTILGSRTNRSYIDINQERRRAYGRSPSTAGTAAIARLDSILASGRDSTGRAFSTEERRALADNIAEHRTELRELASIEPAPPTLLFDGTMTLYLGRMRVDLQDRGPGNSPSDVTVYLPAERVLFSGDLVVLPVPYAFGTTPLPWIAVLRDIEATPIDALVPGHGPVQHDLAYVRQVRELFEEVRARVEPLVRSGAVQAEAERGFSIADLRDRFVRPGDVTAAVYWDALLPGLFRDTWACVAGNRC